MVVKLRLARLSKRHQPFYNIVVAKDRSARDAKPMEVLGTYNPVPQVPLAVAAEDSPSTSSASGVIRRYKDIQLDITRTKYWLGVGAQPSEGVQGILGMLGLWEGKPGTKEALGRKGGLPAPVAEVKSVEAPPVDVASLIVKQRQRSKNKGA